MNSQDTVKYHRALEAYLQDSKDRLTPVTSSRVVKAREKLKKLTSIQFGDLSTDVYDEMERRNIHDLNPNDPNSVSFLPSQTSYHPKRNQARQKLAALPTSRFKDLVNDVLYEIGNRMTPEDVAVANSVPEPVSKRPNLTIDAEKSNNYYQNKKFDPSSGSNTPITTQSQIKPTTLVPKKSELTWSSDEESDDEHGNGNAINRASNGTHDFDAINRSPSKRYTIATNEVLNAHAPADVEFPVDDAEPTTDDVNQFESKSRVHEFENNHDNVSQFNALQMENEELKKSIEELKAKNFEDNEQMRLLNSKYQNYDEINNELLLLRENYFSQSEELEELKQATDLGHANQLSVEDSREFDTLKTYLDKVLEENEEMKMKIGNLESIEDKYETLVEKYHNLQEEQESMQNTAVEHQDLLRKFQESENKCSALQNVSDKYKTLQNQFEDLQSENNALKAAKQAKPRDIDVTPALASSGNAAVGAVGAVAGLAVGAATTAAAVGVSHLAKSNNVTSDDQNAPITPVDQIKTEFPIPSHLPIKQQIEVSRAQQIENRLTKITDLPNLANNHTLLTSTGLISIKQISKVYASLETILVYLASNRTESSGENVYQYDNVDPTLLFDQVAKYVSSVNELCDEININSTDSLYSRVEEKRRVLKNSISNALSTTKHFAIYRHLLPELILNAALNDVYFSVCSLVSIVKIYSELKIPDEVSKFAQEQHDDYMKDNAVITATPLAFKTRSGLLNRSPNASFTENSVRPLRITERLASISTPSLDNPELSKPGSTQQSRTSSPMLMNTSILPMIVASSDEINIIKSSPKLKSKLSSDTTDLANGEKIESNTDIDNNDNGAAVENKIFNNVNGSEISLLSVESRYSTDASPEKALNIGSKNSIVSPIRGRNILDKLKKFDSSIEDMNESIESNKSSPNSKVNISGDVAKAFNKFGAKRRSVENNSNNSRMNDNPFIEESKESTTDENKSNGGLIAGVVGTGIAAVVGTGIASAVGSGISTIVDTGSKVGSKLDEGISSISNTSKTLVVESDEESKDVEVVQENVNATPSEKRVEIEDKNADELNGTTDPIVNEESSEPLNTEVVEEVIKSAEEEDAGKNDLDNEEDIPVELEEPSVPLITPTLSIKKNDTVDSEDFNKYEGKQDTLQITNEGSLPSAGSALDIDEKLAKRVSRRLSRRMSRIPAQVQSKVQDVSIEEGEGEGEVDANREGGWKYDSSKYEDEYEDDDEEEDFDIDNFNTLNPDNTLRELLLYLEHQTVEVIKAIQQTLQSIRDPKATKGLLRIGAGEINNVVNQMAEGTSTLMNQSRYVESMGHAKYVVGVLEDCVKRMEILYGEDLSKDDEFAGKNFKQRSAGIAFDVARSTKELVKTVEEASLRDEIAVLDSRLNR